MPPRDTPAAEREWALHRLEEFLDDGTRLADRDAARLLVAVQTTSTRDALWEKMTLENSAAHQSLWVDMTRRAPDEVRAPAASLAAFASWLSGDGAKAWCALDEVPTDQNYPMAAIVAGALEGALPPSEWESRRSLITGLSAGLDLEGLDLEDLDESYTPGSTSARAPERTSPPSLGRPVNVPRRGEPRDPRHRQRPARPTLCESSRPPSPPPALTGAHTRVLGLPANKPWEAFRASTTGRIPVVAADACTTPVRECPIGTTWATTNEKTSELSPAHQMQVTMQRPTDTCLAADEGPDLGEARRCRRRAKDNR